MKKTLIIFTLFSLSLPIAILAEDVDIDNPLGTTENIAEIVDRLVAFLLNIALALAPLIFVIGGFMYFTSGGDPQKVSRGTKIMVWAAAGLFTILLAKGFVVTLKTIIGIEDGGD